MAVALECFAQTFMQLPLRRILLGRPLHTEQAHHEKLPKILALPVFSSDAISSVAYASEEIMAALLLFGTAIFGLTPWLTLGIVLLLVIVTASYRQTVMAYPSGGGAYIVARDNLGELPAQAAGAALLLDYVLTVSVSVASGISAIVALVTTFHPKSNIGDYVVIMCLVAIAFIAVMNLRGVRESGALFAIPTYSFVLLMYAVIGIGLYKIFVLHSIPMAHTDAQYQAARYFNDAKQKFETSGFGLFLILHAFASGCTAMTGVEAISNGVPAFKDPASKNASTTMIWMSTILGSIFLGLSYLAVHIRALPAVTRLPGSSDSLGDTVISQVGKAAFGTGPLYIALQIATCLILIVAANTSYADFPRLSSIMARDGFLPRQLANVGDKLVYNNGIYGLTLFSALLVVAFRGSVDALIPLYAIGVFLSFTLSQTGMVRRWAKLKSPGWKFRAFVNGLGALCTFVVTIVFGIVKFSHGAWLVVILIPALIFGFSLIHKHYRSVAQQLSLEGFRPRQGFRSHMLVLVPDIHRGVIPALQYARSLSSDAKALHVSIDPAREARVRERFTLWSRGIPLVVLPSPYRSLIEPVLAYIDELQRQDPSALITVVIPEFVPTGWWAKLLHGQAGFMLALRLHARKGVVVINVPYHIDAFVPLGRPSNGNGTLGHSNGHKEVPVETGSH